MNATIATHRTAKKQTKYTDDQKRTVLKMAGAYTKEEIAEEMGIRVAQVEHIAHVVVKCALKITRAKPE